MRVALAILAAFLVAGCGAVREETAGLPGRKHSGFIVFNGYPRPEGPPGGYFGLRPDGTGLRKLPFPEWADLSLSADGRFAATLFHFTDGSRLIVSRADGSERRVVALPPDGSVEALSLSPDGRSVAFAYTPLNSAYSDVWTVSVEGGRPERLTSTGGVTSVAWSPDGARIAFAVLTGDFEGDVEEYEGDLGDIYVVRADGSDPRRVARGFTLSYQVTSLTPAWSPDGTRIAFEDAQHQISIVDAEGGQVKVVAANGLAPAWSRDGKRLAFLRRSACECDELRIFVVDAGGDVAQQVGPAFVGSARLSWTTADLLPSPERSKRGVSRTGS